MRPAEVCGCVEQPERLELGELAADGRRGDAEPRAVDDRLRADRLAGGDVLLDDPAEDVALACAQLVHLQGNRIARQSCSGEARGRRAHGARPGCCGGSWTPVASRGYALGDRWLVRLDDGRTVFAKRAIGEPTAESLRAEQRVYAALRVSFMPQLLGWEDAELPLLVLEDLSAARWPPPWSPASVRRGARHARRGRRDSPAAGLSRLVDDPPTGWDDVARDPRPFLQLGLCSDAWLDEALPALLEATDPSLLDGDALLHFDVRSDNLCIRDGDRAVLVDWNLACVGHPAFDVAFWLPSLVLERGPAIEEIEASGRTSPASLRSSRASSPPGRACRLRRCAHRRGFQLAQLEVALPWAVRVLEAAGARPAAQR